MRYYLNYFIDPILTAWSNMKYGINRLVIWFPVIWRDRDWSYEYLLEIIAFKLHLMEIEHRNDPHHPDNKKYESQIHECREVLLRLIGNNYLESEWDAFHAKWGEFNWEASGPLQMVNVKTKADERQNSKEFKTLMDRELKLERQDERLFVSSFVKNYRGWWT